MKYFPFFLLLGACLFIGPVGVKAQETAYFERVILKDESVFEGYIQEYVKDEYLVLELRGGSQIRINAEEIDRVEQLPDFPRQSRSKSNPWIGRGDGSVRIPKKRTYEFPERGMYSVTSFGTMIGSNPLSEGNQMGVQLTTAVGYQFNHKFGLGGGVGIMAFNLGDGASVFPLFVEARGYLKRKIVSPYYRFATGYSFAFKNEASGILEADGGLMFHPAIGYRLSGAKTANFLIDVGYQYQAVSYLRQSPIFGDFEEQSINYQRIVIRVSLLF